MTTTKKSGDRPTGSNGPLYTILANLVVGFAIALMLLGAMLLRGEAIDARRGLLVGHCRLRFAVSLLPALGLPPELPGTPAADIVDPPDLVAGCRRRIGLRGIALLVFSRNWGLMVVGVAVLLITPHVVGAPQPPSHAVALSRCGLAGEFVVASLIVSAFLWSLTGLACRLALSARVEASVTGAAHPTVVGLPMSWSWAASAPAKAASPRGWLRR